MRGLPWKESSVQVGGLDERTSSLFLIASILSLKKSRKRFEDRSEERLLEEEMAFCFRVAG